jgi:esterase/lipase
MSRIVDQFLILGILSLTFIHPLIGQALPVEKDCSWILIHGLNNNINTMTDFAELIRKAHPQASIEKFLLPGHAPEEDLSSDQALKWSDSVISKVQKSKTNICLVGYSLGGIVALRAGNEIYTDSKVDKIILIAPAIFFKPFGSIGEQLMQYKPLISFLSFFEIKFPSLIPKQIRAHLMLSPVRFLNVAQLALEFRETIKKNNLSPIQNIPVSVLLTKGDELIDSNKTIDIGNQFSRPWNIKILPEKTPSNTWTKHNLVEKRVYTNEEWNEVSEWFLKEVR